LIGNRLSNERSWVQIPTWSPVVG